MIHSVIVTLWLGLLLAAMIQQTGSYCEIALDHGDEIDHWQTNGSVHRQHCRSRRRGPATTDKTDWVFARRMGGYF